MLLLGAALVAPIVVSAIHAVTLPWYPAGDWAMIELRTLDVTSGDPPLVGPYSRLGWNHPGPMLFWLLAVPYELSGRASSSLLVGAGAINAVAVAVALWLVHRRADRWGTITWAAGTAVLMASLGWTTLRDPWNPWVSLLPFALALVATWSSWQGDRWGPPVLVVTGSFLVQTHAGFAPMVAALGILAAGAWLVSHRDRPWPIVVAGGLAVACWTPVIVDALTGGDNLSRLIDQAGGGDPALGLGPALGIAAEQLAPIGPWSGAHEHLVDGIVVTDTSPLWLLVPVAAWLVAARAARTLDRHGPLRLQVVAAVAALSGVVATSRITGELHLWLVRWWWPIAALWWASIAWSAISWRIARRGGAGAHTTRIPTLTPRIAAGALAALVALGAVGFAAISAVELDEPVPVAGWTPTLEAVTDDTVATLGPGPVEVRADGPDSGWVQDGLVVQLAKRDVEVVVPDEGLNRYKFGQRRLTSSARRPPTASIVVVTGDTIDDHRGSGTVLAQHPGDDDHPAVAVILDGG